MMWRWLKEHDIIALHGELLAEHGGADGVRDPDIMPFMPERLKLKTKIRSTAVFDLASVYAAIIIRERPFANGNTRTGFLAACVFLDRNGWSLEAPEAEAFLAVTALKNGDWDDAVFAHWLKENAVRKGG